MGLKWAGHLEWRGEMINSYKMLAGKPGGKRRHRRPGLRKENDIRKNFSNVGQECVLYSSGSGERTVANSNENSNELSDSRKFEEFHDQLSDYLLIN
jgi:hypothetical protein